MAKASVLIFMILTLFLSTAQAQFTWTTSQSTADLPWQSVAYGNGVFVAVANGITGNGVMTSPDGSTWTSRSSAADNLWYSVTYGNGLFVAVAQSGTGNRVMSSPNGIDWTSRSSAADNLWYSVTYGNGLFVAVAASGTNRVMTSPNGIDWTSRISAADNHWCSVTYGNGLFVAVATSGTGNRVMTSPDGSTWTSRSSAADNDWLSVTYGNGLFVAVAQSGTGNRVMTSTDGITWISQSSAADNNWCSVTYGNGLFVAVASSGTDNRVMTSPNGIDWTSQTSAANNSWQSVAYGNGGFVAVANSGTGNRVMKSFEPPTAQPTNLYFSTTITGGNNNIVLHYTASASIEKYLILRKTGSAPTFVPSDGTEYTVGAQGSDQVVYAGTAVTATEATVTSNTAYHYKIYAYNGSAATTKYLTTNPLSGNTTVYSSSPGAIAGSGTTSASAGFPNAGVNVTFPGGTTGTTLAVTKTAAAPASNLYVLPGVKGVKNLYFTITSTNATPGTYTLIMDFSDLGLTDDKWASFKVLKRTDATSPWVDVTTLGATIVSRQTDGVWGRFTISGLSSFSEFALGEISDVVVIVSNLGESVIDLMMGDALNINAQAFTTNGNRYDLTAATLSILNSDAPSNAVLKLYGALPNGQIDIAGGVLVTFGAPELGIHNYNARFTPSGSCTLLASTTYWLVFNSTTISNFNYTESMSYTGVGTLPATNTDAWSYDGGISYDYYDGWPFLFAVEGNIILSNITWDGSENSDWNTAANWSINAVPTSVDYVLIPNTVSNYPILIAAGACNNIAMQSGASLLGNNYLTVSGTAAVDRAIPGASQAWHFLSSPMAAQAISPAFTPAPATSYDFFAWYEPTGEWANFKNTTVAPTWNTANGSTNFTVGKGYLVEYLGTGLTKQFTGSLNAGSVSPALTKSGTGDYAAYNLVGNPYPSAMDWKAASGWTRTSLAGSDIAGYDMSIWNDVAGQYGSFNSAGSSGNNDVTQYIAVGEGFMVKATSAGTLGMADGVRVHNTQAYLKSTDAIANILRMKVAGNVNSYSDEIVIEFGHPTANGGAEKMFSFYETAPSLYTVKPEGKYSVDFRGEAGAVTIPLSFKAGADGNYTITASQLESFTSSTDITLEDVKLNTTQNLIQNPVYTFSSAKTDDGARFLLHFGGTFSIGENTKEQPFVVYASGNTVCISNASGSEMKGEVYVYNTLGQIMMQQKLSDNLAQFSLNTGTGYYLVKVITEDNAYTSKVFIRR